MAKKSNQKKFGRPPRHRTNVIRIGKIPTLDQKLFKKHTDELHDYCIKIRNEKDKTITQLMKNYVVIRLKSVLEYHLKAFISKLIDNKILNIKAADVLSGDVTLSLNVLDNLRDVENFSKGKILTAFMKQLPPKTIDEVMSRINGVDFFPWYQEIEEVRTGARASTSYFEYIEEMNDHRNEIIHQLEDTTLTIQELDQEVFAFEKFIVNLFTFSTLNLAIKNNVDKTDIDKACKFLKINKTKLKELTEKHKVTFND